MAAESRANQSASSVRKKVGSRPDAHAARLGKYRIRRKLGAGGMGEVYLAVDEQLNRTVALKLLPKSKAENPTLVRRFQAEARSAAQLRHENIVTVYEAGKLGGHLFMALEYVEGTDIHALISRHGPLAVKRSIAVVAQAAEALQHAFEQHIVHRDIKPSNLLVTREGTVKLADMGLARSVDDSEGGITRAGMTVGTVDYMSPEQASNSKAADVRSDIYSLGCTWYQMLTRRPPFPEGDLANKLYAHATAPRPDPREIDEKIPEDVVKVMHRMMAIKPIDRYPTPRELLEALRKIDTSPPKASATFLSLIDDALQEEGGVDETGAKGQRRRAPQPSPPRGRATVPPRSGVSGGASPAVERRPPPRRPSEEVAATEEPEEASTAMRWYVGAIAVLVLLLVGGVALLDRGPGDIEQPPGAGVPGVDADRGVRGDPIHIRGLGADDEGRPPETEPQGDDEKSF